MKTLKFYTTLILLAIISAPTFSQSSNELFKFSEQVNIEGLSKETLYERAKVLFEDKYNNSPNFLKMNKNVGSLAGGGVNEASISKRSIDHLHYKIIMVLNDNGYSLKVTDFYYAETKKSGDKEKRFVHDDYQQNTDKKNKKLKDQAIVIARQVSEEVKKEMFRMVDGQIVEIQGN